MNVPLHTRSNMAPRLRGATFAFAAAAVLTGPALSSEFESYVFNNNWGSQTSDLLTSALPVSVAMSSDTTTTSYVAVAATGRGVLSARAWSHRQNINGNCGGGPGGASTSARAEMIVINDVIVSGPVPDRDPVPVQLRFFFSSEHGIPFPQESDTWAKAWTDLYVGVHNAAWTSQVYLNDDGCETTGLVPLEDVTCTDDSAFYADLITTPVAMVSANVPFSIAVSLNPPAETWRHGLGCIPDYTQWSESSFHLPLSGPVFVLPDGRRDPEQPVDRIRLQRERGDRRDRHRRGDVGGRQRQRCARRMRL